MRVITLCSPLKNCGLSEVDSKILWKYKNFFIKFFKHLESSKKSERIINGKCTSLNSLPSNHFSMCRSDSILSHCELNVKCLNSNFLLWCEVCNFWIKNFNSNLNHLAYIAKNVLILFQFWSLLLIRLCNT